VEKAMPDKAKKDKAEDEAVLHEPAEAVVNIHDPSQLEHGMSVLAKLVRHARDEGGYTPGAMSRVDNQDFKTDLEKYHDKFVNGREAHLHGLASKHYPEHDVEEAVKGLDTDGAEDPGATGEDEEVNNGRVAPMERSHAGNDDAAWREAADEGGAKNSPAAEEVLERYGDAAKGYKTRVVGHVRKSRSGKLYFVGTHKASVAAVTKSAEESEKKMSEERDEEEKRRDEEREHAAEEIGGAEEFLDEIDGEDCDEMPGGMIPDEMKKQARHHSKALFGIRKRLITKTSTSMSMGDVLGDEGENVMEGAEKFLDGVADDRRTKHLKVKATKLAKSLYGVRCVLKNLTEMGKIQHNGGSGSPLRTEGKVQRNGGPGSELTEMGAVERNGGGNRRDPAEDADEAARKEKKTQAADERPDPKLTKAAGDRFTEFFKKAQRLTGVTFQ